MPFAPDDVVVPSRQDPVARSASEVIGGPLGRYAVPSARGWRHTAAWLAALSSVPLALGVAQKSHCVEQGWNTPDQFWHMCFSDLPTTFTLQNLGAGIGALITGAPDAPTPAHPPLTSIVTSLLGGLVPDESAQAQARFYFGLWSVLAAVLLALAVWWASGAARRHPVRAAHLALSPVVVLVALVGPDLLGVTLTCAGLYLWARGRPVASGVVLGLAISAGSYPVLVVVAILLVSLRAGRMREARTVAVAAAASFVAVLAVLLVGNPEAAVRAYATWATAPAGFGSLWVLPQLAGSPLPTGVVTALAVLGWLVALAVGALLALGGERRPGVAEVALVMVAIVLVTGKTFPVQASLWLLPFVALVGLAWRDHLIWAGAEALHFGAVWLYLAGVSVPDRGLPYGWYGVALVVRLAAVVWLARQTWAIARARPALESDPEERDDLAGPLAHAPDALVVRVV